MTELLPNNRTEVFYVVVCAICPVVSHLGAWLLLIHFRPTFHFNTPRKQKTVGFLMFSGSIEVEHWLKMG